MWEKSYLEIFLIAMISSSMREKDIVSNNIRFNR